MASYLDADIIRLKSMKLHNFMGIDGELFIDFDDTSEIIGKNGAGKSTILDAIAFVFCYTDAFGNSNTKVAFSKAGEIDTETYVEIVAKVDNIEKVFKRTFSVTKTGKQTSSLYVDHRDIKSTEWKKSWDKDIFLSLINPKYISSLSASQVKALLIKFVEMKGISTTDILSSMSEEAFDALIEELEEQDIETVKTHYEAEIKQNNALIKDLKAEIKKLSLVDKYEMPEDEFNINGIVYTESAAFETVMDEYAADPSEKNKTMVKVFMEQKAHRAGLLERFAMYNKAQSDIKDNEDDIAKLEDENKDIEKKISYVEEFYETVLSEIGIEKRVPDIKFSFKDALGESDFQILYKDVPLKECSFAEQVKAGIQLSDYLMEYIGLSYPMFIDNAECITELPTMIGSYRQMVSFTVERDVSLSRYVDDVVEDLVTLETMPRGHIKGRVKTRLLGTNFEVAS